MNLLNELFKKFFAAAVDKNGFFCGACYRDVRREAGIIRDEREEIFR